MVDFSTILENAFSGFNLIFLDYVKFFFAVGLVLILFFGLFDLFFRQ
jgi:hypothetical protein